MRLQSTRVVGGRCSGGRFCAAEEVLEGFQIVCHVEVRVWVRVQLLAKSDVQLTCGGRGSQAEEQKQVRSLVSSARDEMPRCLGAPGAVSPRFCRDDDPSRALFNTNSQSASNMLWPSESHS